MFATLLQNLVLSSLFYLLTIDFAIYFQILMSFYKKEDFLNAKLAETPLQNDGIFECDTINCTKTDPQDQKTTVKKDKNVSDSIENNIWLYVMSKKK